MKSFREMEAEAVAHYVLETLHARFPEGWLGSRRAASTGVGPETSLMLSVPLSSRMRERLRGTDTLHELLKQFMLKSIRHDSQMGLAGWLEGTYPLELRHDIPTPLEMLTAQCEGRRFVTWLTDRQGAIGRHAGPFEFLLHDLEHAHKFFGDPASHRGQIRFFRLLHGSLPCFARWVKDPLFNRDLEYLMSDMNSHPLHLLKYMKAIVLSAALREEGTESADLSGFWRELLCQWQMPEDIQACALRVNHPGHESPEDQLHVSAFFMGDE